MEDCRSARPKRESYNTPDYDDFRLLHSASLVRPMQKTPLTAIVALSQHHAIGRANQMLFHLPEDLKYFKQKTLGHCLIMGRKTYESIGRPLPARTTIVLSRNASYSPHPEVLLAKSIEEALALCPAGKEAFLAGGGLVYEEGMKLCNRLLITRIDSEPAEPADTFFPPIDLSLWTPSSIGSWQKSSTGLTFRFEAYARR